MTTAIAALIGLADSSAGYLAPGEAFVMVGELQAIDFWKPKRALKAVSAPGASGPFGTRQIGAAITNRRLLLFTGARPRGRNPARGPCRRRRDDQVRIALVEVV